LLAKQPEQRFDTPAAAAAALEGFAAGSDLRALAARAAAERSARSGEELVPQGSIETTRKKDRTPFPNRAQEGGSPPWRRHIRLAALVAGLAAILGVGLLAGRWLTPAPAPHDEPAKDDPSPVVEVGRWTILRQEPKRLWPQELRDDFSGIWDDKRLALRVTSPGLAFFAFGEAWEPGYQIQVGMKQTPWIGGGGLFIGYRQLQREGPPVFRCQVFRLVREQNQEEFAIERLLLELRRSAGGLGVDHMDVSRCSVPPPVVGQEHVLDVEVRGRVQAVRWNGQLLLGLVKGEFSTRVDAADQHGTYGIYTAQTFGTFLDARYMVLERGRK
jgi:hypothetical protein